MASESKTAVAVAFAGMRVLGDQTDRALIVIEPMQGDTMKTTLLADTSQEKTYALIFDKDDEVIGELTAFARTRRISAAHFTAIGAFREVTLAYFDPVSKRYRNIPVREQVEVLSLVGDIALDGGEPKIHAHVVVGKADATAHGGHLVEARVWPTLELVLTESPRHLRRRSDAETGLALIDLTVPETPSV